MMVSANLLGDQIHFVDGFDAHLEAIGPDDLEDEVAWAGVIDEVPEDRAAVGDFRVIAWAKSIVSFLPRATSRANGSQ